MSIPHWDRLSGEPQAAPHLLTSGLGRCFDRLATELAVSSSRRSSEPIPETVVVGGSAGTWAGGALVNPLAPERVGAGDRLLEPPTSPTSRCCASACRRPLGSHRGSFVGKRSATS
jgi:hypothetical protein